MRNPLGALVLLLVLPLLVAGPVAGSTAAAGTVHPATGVVAGSTGDTVAADAVPELDVTVLASNLVRAWDVQELPTGELLVGERQGRLSLVSNGRKLSVGYPTSTLWTAGVTGLMGLAVDPDFENNHRIYSCQGGNRADGTHDVRVVAFTLSMSPRRARFAGTLRNSIPIADDGQHGGCRLLIASDGSLLVGTGDATTGTNPRNLNSLGGKTLRLDRFTGAAWPTNPYIGQRGVRPWVQTFGHRNVQGLAERADGTLWSIEQGTAVDDEVNLLVGGGDYGWNPVPGYNQRVPMTDHSLPGTQIDARWSSGPTPAASGGTFVRGAQWGALDGSLAVACLEGEQVRFLTFDAAGTLVGEDIPPELTSYGRVRTVTRAANGDLLVLTDAGGATGVLLRVRPV